MGSEVTLVVLTDAELLSAFFTLCKDLWLDPLEDADARELLDGFDFIEEDEDATEFEDFVRTEGVDALDWEGDGRAISRRRRGIAWNYFSFPSSQHIYILPGVYILYHRQMG